MIYFNNHLREEFDFTESEIKTVMSHTHSINLQKGDYFLREGEYCKSVAFVSSGTIIYYENMDGEKKYVILLLRMIGFPIRKFTK